MEKVNLEMDELQEQFVRSNVKIINYDKVWSRMYETFDRSIRTMEFKVWIITQVVYIMIWFLLYQVSKFSKLYRENKKKRSFQL